MNYAYIEVVCMEVPNEISLCIGITGCPIHCPGCHSKELWDANYGFLLTEEVYTSALLKYKDKCSCICFMGGEWYQNDLIRLLIKAHNMDFKTALYTGENQVSYDIQKHLDYIKVGSYREELGGLDTATTNQRMLRRETDGGFVDVTKEFLR